MQKILDSVSYTATLREVVTGTFTLDAPERRAMVFAPSSVPGDGSPINSLKPIPTSKFYHYQSELFLYILFTHLKKS